MGGRKDKLVLTMLVSERIDGVWGPYQTTPQVLVTPHIQHLLFALAPRPAWVEGSGLHRLRAREADPAP